MNTFVDTRGNVSRPVTFCQAIVQGIAPGGGLYVPQSVPRLDLGRLCSLAEMPYHARAALVYKAFDIDVDDTDVDALMGQVYGDAFDDPRVAPVVEVAPGTCVLELFHGPTSAFKDMALQCLPRFFQHACAQMRERGELDHGHLILVATSGDTGKAALEGFAGREHVSIAVFYPDGGVSDVQLRQMTTQRGDNVAVFAARGDFDGCQGAVKAAFADREFCVRLLSEHNVALSSANSINWGRLMPQVVYYLSAYADMVAAGLVERGAPIDVCVPTGNFGNILAAYYAGEIGMPLGRLLCASNENNVLTDFIRTGVYDVRGRRLHLTPSPSMDILVSSNLERQLFELTGRDSARVAGWMADLASSRRFQVDDETLATVQARFAADFVTNESCLQAIGRAHRELGYLPDPHTAVALEVADRLRGDNPVLVASTAHWAKFGPDVWRGLNGMAPGDPLPAPVASLDGVELDRAIARLAHSDVPAGIQALEGLPRRFSTVVEAGEEGVEAAVLDWLGSR